MLPWQSAQQLPQGPALNQRAHVDTSPPTRCTMMQEPELPMRPLQNHLPVLKHLTTADGLCTPQYLHENKRVAHSTHMWCCTRVWPQKPGLYHSPACLPCADSNSGGDVSDMLMLWLLSQQRVERQRSVFLRASPLWQVHWGACAGGLVEDVIQGVVKLQLRPAANKKETERWRPGRSWTAPQYPSSGGVLLRHTLSMCVPSPTAPQLHCPATATTATSAAANTPAGRQATGHLCRRKHLPAAATPQHDNTEWCAISHASAARGVCRTLSLHALHPPG